MNKKEVLELKRRFKKDQATFTQLVGCYVDCNHNKVCKFGGKFLTLEEDEYYKYLEIANKVLSGTVGSGAFCGPPQATIESASTRHSNKASSFFIDFPHSTRWQPSGCHLGTIISQGWWSGG